MEETEEPIDLGISGHEMLAFDCLVPSRQDNGKLVFGKPHVFNKKKGKRNVAKIIKAPKQFEQYLILNQVVDIPDSTAYAQAVLETPVYKRDQPEGLKMRFKPYGYYSGKYFLVIILFYVDLLTDPDIDDRSSGKGHRGQGGRRGR